MIELTDHKKIVNISSQFIPEFESEELLFLGMRTLAKGTKKRDNAEYYHTLPIEHTSQFPVSFRGDGEELEYDEAARIWLAEPLHKAMFAEKEVEANFDVEIISSSRNVIILNCLDSCYGHNLDKLFNAQRHLEDNSTLGLIIIIHPSLRSLVPQGVSEIWEVDIAFSDLNFKIKDFDRIIKSRMKNYDKVYLSKADMSLDYSNIDIEKFTKCKPFPEDERYKKTKQITFILREDRFWLNSKPNQFIYLVSMKFKLMKFLKFYFIFLQNRNVKRLARKVKKNVRGVSFMAVGLGKTGKLGQHIIDKREHFSEYINHEYMRDEVYSKSNMVIGVHGSHLLLASALASSFISIYQEYKIQGYSDDFMPRYANAQKQAFLGRFLSENESTNSIFEHVKYMLIQ